MSASGSSTSLAQILSPGQQQVLDALIAQVLPQIGQPGEVFEGQIAPGASQLQQLGFGNLQGGQVDDVISNLLSGNVDSASREKLFGAEQASQMGQLQDTFKLIEERANSRGAGRSGSLNQAMTQAAGDTQLGLGRFYGGLARQDEQLGFQRQLAGLGAAGARTQAQLGGGQIQRNIAGQQNAEAYNKWLAAQPFGNPTVAAYLPAILGTQTQTPVTKSFGVGL